MNEPERLTLSVWEAGKLLGLGRAAMYRAVASGQLPCLRVGKRLLIPKVALERLLEQAGQRKEVGSK